MLRDLANLGPKSEAMLVRSGITCVGRLAELGSVRAYLRVKQCEERVSLNLLWALEGALSGRSWQEVAKQDRLRLLLELEALEPAQRKDDIK